MATPQILIDQPDVLIAWAQDQLGVTFFDDARAIGWGEIDDIRAVVVYDRWSVNDCCIHLVSDQRPGWLSRNFIIAGFSFPFIDARLRRVTGLVTATNQRALTLNRHFGFRDEGRLRFASEDGSDLIIMGMLREECRFIPKEAHHG